MFDVNVQYNEARQEKHSTEILPKGTSAPGNPNLKANGPGYVSEWTGFGVPNTFIIEINTNVIVSPATTRSSPFPPNVVLL